MQWHSGSQLDKRKVVSWYFMLNAGAHQISKRKTKKTKQEQLMNLAEWITLQIIPRIYLCFINHIYIYTSIRIWNVYNYGSHFQCVLFASNCHRMSHFQCPPQALRSCCCLRSGIPAPAWTASPRSVKITCRSLYLVAGGWRMALVGFRQRFRQILATQNRWIAEANHSLLQWFRVIQVSLSWFQVRIEYSKK